MLAMQWHLFPLQLAGLFFFYLGWRKVGLTFMLGTLIFAAICFNTHITKSLDIIL